MSATPKQWTITVVSPASGPLQVRRQGASLPSEIGVGLTTPVEVLLVSVGTCFALSCHAAFTVRAQERVELQVTVIGRKDAQLPSRLAEITLEVVFDPSLPLLEAQAISALAKRMCTVTNTLTSEPPCSLSVDLKP